MNETRRYRLNAAECLLAAKTCRSGYREIILSISVCWHRLALQDEAMYTLLANWTSQIPPNRGTHTDGSCRTSSF
jgi:hypothetical protein